MKIKFTKVNPRGTALFTSYIEAYPLKEGKYLEMQIVEGAYNHILAVKKKDGALYYSNPRGSQPSLSFTSAGFKIALAIHKLGKMSLEDLHAYVRAAITHVSSSAGYIERDINKSLDAAGLSPLTEDQLMKVYKKNFSGCMGQLNGLVYTIEQNPTLMYEGYLEHISECRLGKFITKGSDDPVE